MLTGTNVLIIEQEFLIALDVQRILEQANAARTVFARTVDEAVALRDGWTDFDLAIVDVPHGSNGALELATQLYDAGVPVVVSTGDFALRRGIPGNLEAPVVVKPFNETDLLGACSRALEADRAQ